MLGRQGLRKRVAAARSGHTTTIWFRKAYYIRPVPDERTLAVLGSGLDPRVYPADDRDLAAEIQERGAIVTELPLGTPPRWLNALAPTPWPI